jgi:mannitol/fructose-specific phosphotransferase system IIA component (Ntr-type)
MSIKLLNLNEAADFLGMEPGDLRALAVCGDIPCVEHGSRMMFDYSELDTWFTFRLIRHKTTAQKSRRSSSGGNSMAGTMSRLCTLETMSTALPGKTKAAVLKSLTELAERSGLLYDPREFLEELRRREEIFPTAMAEGVALVHPERRDEYICEAPFIAVARSERPVHFGEADGIPTDIFFVISAPDNTEHLKILSHVCRVIMESGLLDALRNAATPQEMLDAVKSADPIPAEE